MFKIKNYEVQPFGDFLMRLELKGKESRMRTRLVKLLQNRLDLIQQEQQQILNDYAEKDENGELVQQEYNGQKGIKLADTENYRKESLILMQEEYKIPIDENNKEMFKSVSHSILECDLSFSGNEALQYDRWCELVEALEF